MTHKFATGACLLSLSCLAMAAVSVPPSAKVMTSAMHTYLAERGDLCLGKFDWPVDVNAVDFANGSRDALQMPVLESLGLVSSSDGSVTMHKDDGSEEAVPAKRYVLTRVGKMFYLDRESVTTVGGKQVKHHGDLCAGKVTLDKVVSVSQPTEAPQPQVTVNYTYHFAPAQWARRPEVLKVFPIIDRIEQGEGQMQMMQRFQLQGGRWIPAGL